MPLTLIFEDTRESPFEGAEKINTDTETYIIGIHATAAYTKL